MVNSWLKCDKIMMNLIKYIYHLKRNLVKRFIMVTCKKIICVLNICYEFVQRFYQMLTFKLLLGCNNPLISVCESHISSLTHLLMWQNILYPSKSLLKPTNNILKMHRKRAFIYKIPSEGNHKKNL